MTWWGWMILGVTLFGAELFAVDAQFYLVFLGLSAVIVGIGELAGLSMPEWMQWLSFAVLSLVSMVTFRKSLSARLRSRLPDFPEGVTGEYVRLHDALGPGRDTRTDFRGSTWTVRNVGSGTISSGARAKVVKVDGLTLHVSID